MWVQRPGAPCGVSHLHPHPAGSRHGPTAGDGRFPEPGPHGDTRGRGQTSALRCTHRDCSGGGDGDRAPCTALATAVPCVPPTPKGPEPPGAAPTSHMWSWKRRRSFCMSSASSAADGSAWMTPARRARSFSFSIFPLRDGTGTARGQPCPRWGGPRGRPCPRGGPQGAAEVAEGVGRGRGLRWNGPGEASPGLAQSLAAALHKTPLCAGGLGGFCSGHGVAYTLVS